MSETQAAIMEEKLHVDHTQPAGDINLMKGHHKRQPWQSPLSHKQGNHPQSQHTPQPFRICGKCGKSWTSKQSPYPANRRTCHKCGEPNHFAKMCLIPAHHKRELIKEDQFKPWSWKTVMMQAAVTVRSTCTRPTGRSQRSQQWRS